jgi:hypothetical protein
MQLPPINFKIIFMERDHMDVLDPEEILELLYNEIHSFLVSEAGEDLDQDLIDITLETSESGELNIELDLQLEITSFSRLDVQLLAEKALAHGIKIADEVCPPYTKIHGHLQKK